MTAAFRSGLHPTEFWEISLYETSLMIDGYSSRVTNLQELLAWHLAPILNSWGAKNITPKDLLGRNSRIEVNDPGALDKLEEMGVNINTRSPFL